LLLTPGAQIARRNVDDAVGVNVEGHFDLRYAAWRGRNANQVEFAQRAVIASHSALALQHVDFNRSLVVCGRRENLALASRNGRVAINQLREDTAERF